MPGSLSRGRLENCVLHPFFLRGYAELRPPIHLMNGANVLASLVNSFHAPVEANLQTEHFFIKMRTLLEKIVSNNNITQFTHNFVPYGIDKIRGMEILQLMRQQLSNI